MINNEKKTDVETIRESINIVVSNKELFKKIEDKFS